MNSKLKQDQLAKELSYSSSNLQSYRHDIKKQSPHKLNAPKRTQKASNDLKRPQMTSKEPGNKIDEPVSKKGKLKGVQ